MGIFSKLMGTKEVAKEELEEMPDKKIVHVEGVDIIDLDTPDIGRYEDDIIEITPTEEKAEGIIEITPVEEKAEGIIEITPVEKKAEGIIEITPVEEKAEGIIEITPVEEKAEVTAEAYKLLPINSVALEAEALLQGTISVEEKLEDIQQEKEKVLRSIENLLSGREKMLKGKTYCQQLNKKKRATLSKTFEEYLVNDDFKDLPKKIYVMEVLKDTVPEIYAQPSIPATELRMALDHVHEIWDNVEKEKESLNVEGETLKNEITQFTLVVNEMRSKHKLSADWEGKKQPLMTMQGKLATRREAYIKKELIMDKKILELSEEYGELQVAFGEHSAYFAKVLGEKAETFVKDPNRTKKLQELLKKKLELENKENELKHL